MGLVRSFSRFIDICTISRSSAFTLRLLCFSCAAYLLSRHPLLLFSFSPCFAFFLSFGVSGDPPCPLILFDLFFGRTSDKRFTRVFSKSFVFSVGCGSVPFSCPFFSFYPRSFSYLPFFIFSVNFCLSLYRFWLGWLRRQ